MRLGRASQFALASTRLALTDASLNLRDVDPVRLGVAFGTTSGEAPVIERFNDLYLNGDGAQIEEDLVSLYPSHALSANVASDIGAPA